MTTKAFPQDVIDAAQAAEAKWDILASITLAQWAVESAWGTAMPAGSNNPFGIKAVAGQPTVNARTHEVIHGRSVSVMAPFRKFASLADAFDEHGRLLAQGRPYAMARTARHDASAFAHALTGVYATDPHYGATLISMINAHNLTQYDHPNSGPLGAG